MKYMLLIYAENKAHRSEKEREDCKNEAVKLAEDLRAKGQYVAANPLEPTPPRRPEFGFVTANGS